MAFAVGYQQLEGGESFPKMVSDYLPQVSEVYFPWPGMATGRIVLGKSAGAVDWGAQEQLTADLSALRSMGVKLDILFNANCYGDRALSASFSNELCSILDYLEGLGLLPDIATTTSPFVATAIKAHFPSVETRASVNMRVDSLSGMEYLSDIFDSFYIRRDLQRDMETLEAFSVWAHSHGKKLCMLANSGCLRYCPYQTFHDNLVAHDDGIDEMKNVRGYQPLLCWKLYNSGRFEEILRASWIRPEDLAHYLPYVDVVKLATRQHSHPRMVLGAYCSGHFGGNLLDLLEPCFSSAFAPYIIDNTAFPADWLQTAGKCAATCSKCGRCAAVLSRVLKDASAISPNAARRGAGVYGQGEQKISDAPSRCFRFGHTTGSPFPKLSLRAHDKGQSESTPNGETQPTRGQTDVPFPCGRMSQP